jgi:serine phosphatase RsbU (regulator of sigma subunit)
MRTSGSEARYRLRLEAGRQIEPDILLEFLLATAREFAGSQPQSDDVTALIVRCPAN